MADDSDGILRELVSEDDDHGRSVLDEMEDYGAWLKPEADDDDYAGLSSDEEKLLGSFSPDLPAEGDALTDDFLEKEIAEEEQAALEEEGEDDESAHIAMDSGLSEEDISILGTGPGISDRAKETESEPDDISDEFFEIDYEMDAQNDDLSDGSPPDSADPLPSENTGSTQKAQVVAPKADDLHEGRELSTDILSKIARELSSLRGELVGMKVSFSQDTERQPADSSPQAGTVAAAPAPVEPAAEATEAAGNIAGTDDSSVFTEEFRNELKVMFAYLDKLLESLPESKIEEFARSEYFDSYKHIFDTLRIS